jgi:hypothetical protein
MEKERVSKDALFGSVHERARCDVTKLRKPHRVFGNSVDQLVPAGDIHTANGE